MDEINQNSLDKKESKKIWSKVAFVILVIIFLGGLVIFSSKKPIQTGEAMLSWNSNNEADLAGYRIYYGASARSGNCPEGGYPLSADVSKTQTPENPSYKLTGLENGKTYYFSITSYDASGNESCFSDEMSKVIPAANEFWFDKIRDFFKK
jgi:hypothetical protein